MKRLHNFTEILLGNIIVLILVASLALLITMYHDLSNTVRNLSTVMIQDRLDLTKHEISSIFDPINQQLNTAIEWVSNGLITDILDQQKLNEIFVPLIKSSNSISSILIANEQGDEYLLLQQDSLWMTRITFKGSADEMPTHYFWKENQFGELVLLNQKRQEAPYDPRSRPWFKLAMDNEKSTEINWTEPYTFFTTKLPGITASKRWKDPYTGKSTIMGMDVLIADLSEFTTTIDITTNGKVFILSNKEEVIGLPRDERFMDSKSRNQFGLKKLNELNIPLINEAIHIYQSNVIPAKYLSFRFNSENWWASIEKYNLSKGNWLYVGVLVPETDFSDKIEGTRTLLIGGFVLIFLFFIIILYSFFRLKNAKKIIALERDKNENLLLNTLPIKVVNDLKEKGRSDPQKFNNVSVFFSDIVGFTKASASLDPKKLIDELNDMYTTFDEIMINHGCERIKTIGDGYLAVCGMPVENDQHAEMMLKAAFEVLKYIEGRNAVSQLKWQLRIGIHSGIVVGGIVGVKKYIYDVFGDTINTASRMESNSEANRINISEQTYLLLKDSNFIVTQNIQFEKRKPITVKGKGIMEMYFVSKST